MTEPHHARDARADHDAHPLGPLYAPAVDHAPRPGRRPADGDLASYPRRVGAFVVDAVLAFAAVGWLALVVRPDADAADVPLTPVVVAGGLGAALALAQWVLHGRRGWTFGRLLCRIRTVDVETRTPIGMGRVLVRGLVVAAGALVCAVGAFLVLASPLVDRTGRRRGWHDRAARDEVLDARALAPARRPADVPAPAAARPVAAGSDRPVDAPDRLASDPLADAPAPRTDVPAWASSALAPASAAAPALRPWSAPAQHEMPAVTGSLRLAPLAPQRSGPDLDTRAIPAVRVALAPSPVPDAPDPASSAPLPAVPGAPAPGASTPGAPALAAPAPGAATPVPPRAAAPQPAPAAPESEPAAPPAPAVDSLRAPAVSALDPVLELTHRVGALADLRADDDVQEETVPLTGPETAEIELSDGRRLYVERTALVGRNPVARTNVRAIRVHDPNRSVSKTHLQIGVEPGGVWVADRGSTNGTVVTLPDGGQVRCGVDQRVRLRVGAVVVFGDCALRLVRGPGAPPAD